MKTKFLMVSLILSICFLYTIKSDKAIEDLINPDNQSFSQISSLSDNNSISIILGSTNETPATRDFPINIKLKMSDRDLINLGYSLKDLTDGQIVALKKQLGQQVLNEEDIDNLFILLSFTLVALIMKKSVRNLPQRWLTGSIIISILKI